MFFCSPQQFLIFLTIFGIITTLFYNYKEVFSKKVIGIAALIISLLYMFMFLSDQLIYWMVIVIILLIPTLVYIIDKKLIDKKYKPVMIFILSLLFAYFIAGVAANACLFLPTSKISFEDRLQSGDTVGFGYILPEEQNIASCSLQGFGIGEIGNDRVQVLFYSTFAQYPLPIYKSVIVGKNEDFILCCYAWTLKDIDGNITIWQANSKMDNFCMIQNWFTPNGVYRTP